jgi:acetate CoA/acetoacetate CoA-transferase alpha subunit
MKIITAKQAAGYIKNNMAIMIGGFMGNGSPYRIIDALVESGVRGLTLIAGDAGWPGKGNARLIASGAVKKMLSTHIGLNPQAGQLMNEGKIEITLIPMGTFTEQIRSGGMGLGGVLTPTGLGTSVAEGKTVITVDGKDYLLEKPLHADAALIRGSIIDEDGNIFYKGTTRNYSPMMAMAADIVIAEAEQIVPVGSIPAENIVTSGIFVDYIVDCAAGGSTE